MGGNQYVPDPRQLLFLKHYFDQKSETFSNAYKSALAAGYAENYAVNIRNVMPDWLVESIEDTQLLKQAQKNLRNFLSDAEDDKKVKADMTKFTLKTLGKDKFSERQELTGKDGESILVLPSEVIKKNDINTSTEKDS